MFMYNNFMSFI